MVETVILPRGLRNNNPGNIRKVGAPEYTGVDRTKTAIEPAFLVFTSMVLGIRAPGVLLLAYERHDRCRSIEDIIRRYAPSVENNTEAYIEAVANRCRYDPTVPYPLTTAASMLLLLEAIFAHENGDDHDGVPFSDKLISPETYASALKLIFPEGPL